ELREAANPTRRMAWLAGHGPSLSASRISMTDEASGSRASTCHTRLHIVLTILNVVALGSAGRGTWAALPPPPAVARGTPRCSPPELLMLPGASGSAIASPWTGTRRLAPDLPGPHR